MTTTLIFLKLVSGGKTIEGEATEALFEKQIALETVSWQMSSTHEPVDDTRDKTKVKTTNRPRRVEVTKFFDRSTINLFGFLSRRTAFEKATITMLRGMAWDDTPRPQMEIELSMGFVEGVTLAASESGKAVGVSETVTLSFRRFKMLYHPPPADGSRSSQAATTFDLSLQSVSGA